MKKCLCIALACLFSTALADAPVVDAYSQGIEVNHAIAPQQFVQASDETPAPPPTPEAAPATSEPAPAAAEPMATAAQNTFPSAALMIRNQTQLSQRIDALEQQVQSLRGQIEVQSHTISQLQQQRHSSAQMMTAAQPVAGATPSAVQVDNAKEALKAQMVYQAAYNEIKARNYSQAMHDLQAFVNAYPNSSFVPNSYYWMGELYLLRGDSAQALTQFGKITQQFPQQAKAADALFKVGLIYNDQGNWAKAKQTFQKVSKQYSGSGAAQLARSRLTQLARAGH